LVPIEETLTALAEMVAAGKVRHIGVANETPWGVMRYLAACAAHGPGLPRIVSILNGYSLLDRPFAVGLAEVAMREHVGLLAYSPLARGLLSGKYLDPSQNLPGRERFSQRRLSATAAYLALAKKHNLDLSALALAFVRQRAFTSSVLMAA